MVATAFVGLVTGCNSRLLGRNRSANQVENSPGAAQNQPATQTRVQRANQPTTQAQNTNQTNAQAQDGTIDPETPNTGGQSGGNQGVSALW